MWAYRLIRLFLRFAMKVFYRQVEVVGLENVPAEGGGAVLFAGNHPNSLIDPVLIITTCGRIVSFAAKDTLFESALLRTVFDALGAVPIRRRADHGGTAVDNAAAFDALYRVLGEGRAVGIFPEGLSHDEAQLTRLKTGAARIALGTRALHPDAPLSIVPCGLTYIHRRHFRSRVLVQYGEHIAIPPGPASADADAVRTLTDELEKALRGLTINAPDWETLRVLDGVRRLYQPPKIPLAHRVELARRFASVYEKVRHEPDIAAIYARVRRYLERLEDAGLSDRDLAEPIGPLRLVAQVARQLAWFLLWLPLAAPGVMVHAPLGLLAGLGGRSLTPRPDVIATTKLFSGILLVLAAYAGIVGLAAWKLGLLAGAVTLVLLPLTGYATVRVLERTASLRRIVTRLARAFLLGRERKVLLAEREALRAEVIRAVERYRPADMELLYPQGSP